MKHLWNKFGGWQNWLLVWCILVLFFAWWGQFARVATVFGQVSFYELLLIPLTLVLLVKNRKGILPSLKQPLVLLPILFVLWTAAATVQSSFLLGIPELLSNGFAYLARLALYLLFAFSLFLWKEQAPLRKPDFPEKQLENAVGIWMFVQAIVGISQFLLLPDTRILFYLGWDDHLSRAFGTFFDPGFFGLFMALGAILFLSRALQIHGRQKLLATVALALSITALALSYSRASYAAFIAGALALAWICRQKSIWLVIPLLVLSLVLLPTDGGGEGQNLLRTRSIEAREEVLQYHVTGLSWQEIIAGRGWYYEAALSLHEQALQQKNPDREDSPVVIQHAQAVDNVYLHMLFSSGIVGLGIFGVWLCLVLWKIRYSGPLLALWAVVLVHSLFSTALLYSWSLLLLGFLSVVYVKTPRIIPSSHE